MCSYKFPTRLKFFALWKNFFMHVAFRIWMCFDQVVFWSEILPLWTKCFHFNCHLDQKVFIQVSFWSRTSIWRLSCFSIVMGALLLMQMSSYRLNSGVEYRHASAYWSQLGYTLYTFWIRVSFWSRSSSFRLPSGGSSSCRYLTSAVRHLHAFMENFFIQAATLSRSELLSGAEYLQTGCVLEQSLCTEGECLHVGFFQEQN